MPEYPFPGRLARYFMEKVAVVAQSVEHVLGKDEVTGSIPVNGSVLTRPQF